MAATRRRSAFSNPELPPGGRRRPRGIRRPTVRWTPTSRWFRPPGRCSVTVGHLVSHRPPSTAAPPSASDGDCAWRENHPAGRATDRVATPTSARRSGCARDGHRPGCSDTHSGRAHGHGASVVRPRPAGRRMVGDGTPSTARAVRAVVTASPTEGARFRGALREHAASPRTRGPARTAGGHRGSPEVHHARRPRRRAGGGTWLVEASPSPGAAAATPVARRTDAGARTSSRCSPARSTRSAPP